MTAGPKPLNRKAGRFAGEAYTLRFIPMREDLSRPEVLADSEYAQRRAIEGTPPGHVLVADCRGEASAAVLGGILATRLKKRGVAAVVADGGVRDGAELAAMELPIFCLGPAAPANIARHFAADVQVAIACGGAAVVPGDIVAGDDDGVVVIPRALAAELAEQGTKQERLERFIQAKVEEGRALPGLYPPDEATLDEYRRWREDGGDAD